MKRKCFSIPECLQCLSFLLYLLGSSLAHIQNGVELSLWLMAFAIVVSFAATALPWFGFHWLRLAPQGSRFGKAAALVLQISSWGTYGLAMFLRFSRNLPRFQTLIMVTTLLWAAWLLIFIYSRYACPTPSASDTLKPENGTATDPVRKARTDE